MCYFILVDGAQLLTRGDRCQEYLRVFNLPPSTEAYNDQSPPNRQNKKTLQQKIKSYFALAKHQKIITKPKTKIKRDEKDIEYQERKYSNTA